MFSKRLKQLRKENDWSQDQLSELLNVSRQSYGRYETGLSEPALDTLVRMADIFNVSLDYLLCRTDSRHNISMMNKYNQELFTQFLDLISQYDFNKR